jgi:hypothetical protein
MIRLGFFPLYFTLEPSVEGLKCNTDDEKLVLRKLAWHKICNHGMVNDSDIQNDNDIHYYHKQDDSK